MAATTEITSAAGLRRAQVFVLNGDGYPDGDQAGITAYDGEEAYGVSSYTKTVPDVQPIRHVGKDRVLAQDFLPPTDGVTAELKTVAQNLTLDAILTDTLVQEIAETQMGGMATDKQGQELDVCVITYRQALDTTPGASRLRRWQVDMFPVARMIPRGGSGGQGQGEEQTYSLIPAVATKAPWGTAFSEVNNGFTEAQVLRFHSQYPPILNKCDGVSGSAAYVLSNTPISAAKTKAYVNGVAGTVSSVDTAAKTATLSVAPTTGDEVVFWYETSDNI